MPHVETQPSHLKYEQRNQASSETDQRPEQPTVQRRIVYKLEVITGLIKALAEQLKSFKWWL